jgi:hypothetical protein
MSHSHPPEPTHVTGTVRGEELALHHKEPGRGVGKQYRTARDSTSIGAKYRRPISPAMPSIPPA